ncbi:MAG: hypothetical protein C0505_02025 [Leptothrix sp. (in: Bacteria)]|nr:hypothetical protein [Leptothrix sp. (in: b-proteobacteria)]
MGRPLAGVEAFAAARRSGGGPRMFGGCIGENAATRGCFAASAAGEHYRTGGLMRRDADGDCAYVSHTQDLAKSAGHTIAPLEVEAALATHPAVAEAASIARPDRAIGELVQAFVTRQPGFAACGGLRAELLVHAPQRLGPVAAPRAPGFASQPPRTRVRRPMWCLVRPRVLGPPGHGDTSPAAGPPAWARSRRSLAVLARHQVQATVCRYAGRPRPLGRLAHASRPAAEHAEEDSR